MSGRKVFLNNSGMGLSTLVVGGGVTALIIMMIMKIINSATITTTQLDRYDTIQEVRDNIYRNLLLSEPSWQCTVDDLTITSLECLRDGSVNCCTGGPPNIMDPSQECTPPDGNPMAVTTGDIKVYTRSNGTCVLMYDSTVPGNGFTMEGQPCNGYTDNGNPNCPWRADVTWEAACVPPNCRGAQQKLNVEFRYADGVEQWSGSTAAARRQRLDFSGIRLKTETKSNMAFAESMVFDTPTVFGSAPHIFNVPYGVQYIMVEAWGAGGGGGSGLPNGIPTDQVTFVDAFGNPGPSI
ncbi:MAG: hypothetical protein KDD50_04885, partial [Bdellovibrionales bacterium]|nr:hypothetical protein [Bdellovibrionales bacterium]